MGKGCASEARHGAPCYETPKSVAPDSTHDFPPVYFLPHTVHHLCYDGVAHEHGAQALGKEDTGLLSGRNGEIFGAKE